MSNETRIFFLSYGVLGHDGRLSELLRSVEALGTVHLLSLQLDDLVEGGVSSRSALRVKDLQQRRNAFTQFKFLLLSIWTSWRYRKPDILFVDDLMSCVAALLILPILRPKIIVQDSREFYFGRKMIRGGVIFLLAERILYRKADLIVCANEERADLMKVIYQLNERPFVFENIRRLPGEKLAKSLSESENDLTEPERPIRIVSTGGCSVARGTINLIQSAAVVQGVHLTIVGKGSDFDYGQVVQFIRSHQIGNVEVVERLPYDQLYRYISGFDIGAVEYHQDDLNNIFCASGKIFEYTSAGLPVVCTPNISLQSVCRRYGIGEASNDMTANIQLVKGDLSRFKERALAFGEIVNPETNRDRLCASIRTALEFKSR